MNICARCGKKLGFLDKHDNLLKFRNALKAGLFPEFKNKKVCLSCQHKLFESPKNPNESDVISMLPAEIDSAILWQKDEIYGANIKCKEFFEDKSKTIGASLGHKGFLVVTNQRILFTCKLGFFSKTYGITYGINLEDIMSVSAGKFGFNDKLVILDKNSQHRDFIQPTIQSFIPKINSAISKRKEQLQSQKEKERVHIMLDFSALKETMANGGIIMTTYKCPQCNASVEIPESGKVLFCQYCNTPIKPIDIFERIKSFFQ